MKYSAALKVKIGDKLVLNSKKDGVFFEVISLIRYPNFTVEELFANSKPVTYNYSLLQKPTKAQLNAYNKQKEKYYECGN